MEVNEEKAKAAKDCLDYNQQLNTVYVAADLSCFTNRSNAINHARSLDNKEIDVFIREADEAIVDQAQTDEATDESFTEPDHRLAVVKAAGGGKDKAFVKTAKPAVIANIMDPVVDPATAEAALLAKIQSAVTIDELYALVPTADFSEAVLAAAQVKAGELVADPPALPLEIPAPDAIPAPDPIPAPETITDKLTELVNEVEQVLHLNQPIV